MGETLTRTVQKARQTDEIESYGLFLRFKAPEMASSRLTSVVSKALAFARLPRRAGCSPKRDSKAD